MEILFQGFFNSLILVRLYVAGWIAPSAELEAGSSHAIGAQLAVNKSRRSVPGPYPIMRIVRCGQELRRMAIGLTMSGDAWTGSAEMTCADGRCGRDACIITVAPADRPGLQGQV